MVDFNRKVAEDGIVTINLRLINMFQAIGTLDLNDLEITRIIGINRLVALIIIRNASMGYDERIYCIYIVVSFSEELCLEGMDEVNSEETLGRNFVLLNFDKS